VDTTDPPSFAGLACAQLFEAAPDALLVFDETGTIRVANGRAERLFGYDRDDLIGERVEVLVSERANDTFAALRKAYCSRRRSRLPARVELAARRSDGSDVAIDVSLNQVDLLGRRWVAATVRDVAAPAAEAEDLSALVIEALEDERKRIADEIHDDSIQVLSAVKLRLGQLRRRIDARDAGQLLARLETDVEIATRRLRRLMFGLRPWILDAEGLVPAIRTYLAELADEAPFSFAVDDEGLEQEPGPATRWTLFRIVQEALTNVRKHAGATHVRVCVESAHGGFLVTVADDGTGFDARGPRGRPTRFGLARMRERAETAGGWLDLQSTAGSGSTVRVWVPEEQP
jgi:PAS domain S-box-containing protein